jgi:hypothetical protein
MNDVVTREPSPAQRLAEVMAKFMLDPSITADKLEAVLKMRRELIAEEQKEAFQAAFARMQADLPQVPKNGVVELVSKTGQVFGRYNFAKWEDMDAVLRPILTQHGFALTFRSEDKDGRLQVTGELMHSGFSMICSINLPPDLGPGRNALQAVGSALSYGKRYVTELLCNIVRKGDDDDANSATDHVITKGEANQMADMLKKSKSDLKKFLSTMVPYAASLEEIRASDYVRCVNAINLKLSRKGADNGNKR